MNPAIATLVTWLPVAAYWALLVSGGVYDVARIARDSGKIAPSVALLLRLVSAGFAAASISTPAGDCFGAGILGPIAAVASLLVACVIDASLLLEARDQRIAGNW